MGKLVLAFKYLSFHQKRSKKGHLAKFLTYIFREETPQPPINAPIVLWWKGDQCDFVRRAFYSIIWP